MRHIAITVFAILITTGIVLGKDLQFYRGTYDKELEAIVLSNAMKMTGLGRQYTDALEALLATVRKAGDLNKTTAVLNEITRFRDERAMPAEPSTILEIGTLQSSYIKQASVGEASRARSVLALTSKYDRALERLQKTLVSANHLDKAREVQEESANTGESAIVVDARSLLLALRDQEPVKQQPTDVSSGSSKKLGPSELRSLERRKIFVVFPDEVSVIEAEDYVRKTRKRAHEWQRVKKGRVMPKHLHAYPDANKVFLINEGKFEDDSPMVCYNLQFQEAGTYYLWICGRGCAGGASIAVGMERNLMELSCVGFFPRSFGWLNKYRQGGVIMLEVEKPGLHEINFWMVEDSFRFDKFLVTSDPDYHPDQSE